VKVFRGCPDLDASMALSPAERRRAIYSEPEDNLVIGEEKRVSVLQDYIVPTAF
jgi:hypothetical protein